MAIGKSAENCWEKQKALKRWGITLRFTQRKPCDKVKDASKILIMSIFDKRGG